MKQLRELADEQLVSLYQEGNNNAFDILLKRYQQKVSEIEAKIAKADIHTTLIANGVITVK